jgi:hypothetical protein
MLRSSLHDRREPTGICRDSVASRTTEVGGVVGLADPTTSKSWFHRELRTLQALAARKKTPTVRMLAQRSHHSRDQLPALSNELFLYHGRCEIACQGQIPRWFRLPEAWMATGSSDGRMDRRVAGGDTHVRARRVSRVRVSRRGVPRGPRRLARSARRPLRGALATPWRRIPWPPSAIRRSRARWPGRRWWAGPCTPGGRRSSAWCRAGSCRSGSWAGAPRRWRA